MPPILFAETVLELTGTVLSLRRRNWLMFSLFAFCAASDLFGFLLFKQFGHYALAWAGWGQRAGKYFLLILLASSICGRFVGEEDSRISRLSAVALTLIGSVVVLKFFCDGSTIGERLMDAEISANVFLMLLVSLGWLTQRGKLSGPWNWIAAGFIIQIGSAIIVTALWTVWDGAKYWYPAGTIPAYLIWLSAMTIKESHSESRTALPNEYYIIGPEWDLSGPDQDWLKKLRISSL